MCDLEPDEPHLVHECGLCRRWQYSDPWGETFHYPSILTPELKGLVCI
jgi:hypothetical protein